MNKHSRAPGRRYLRRLGARPPRRLVRLAAHFVLVAILLFGTVR